MINDQLQKNENATMNAFNRIEANLDLTENKIDNYILYLYSNKPLLRDFICFFGNNAETYLTNRLDSSDGTTQISSVLDDLQQFVFNNQFIVKQIAFQSPDHMPSITICTFLTLTNSFKLFDQNFALSGGAPAKSSSMLALDIFSTFYGRNGYEGVGQAKAVVFFIMVALIALIQLRLTRSKEVEN